MKRNDKGKYNSCSMTAFYVYPKRAMKQLRGIKSITKEAQRRLTWIEYYKEHGKRVRLTCRHFGISTRTFYKWKERLELDGLEGMESASRRPYRVRQPEIAVKIQDRVESIRKKYPAWSKYKIAVILDRDYGIKLSASSVGRILKRKGLIDRTASRRRKKAAKRKRLRTSRDLLLNIKEPGDLVQIDTKHINYPWSEKAYQFNLIDCLTKVKVSKVYCRANSRLSKEFFREAEKELPFKIKAVQSDNGSEFEGFFDSMLRKRKIPHYYTYPNCPKQNSIVERSIQTDVYEFYRQGNLVSGVKKQNERLSRWNDIYNNVRPHQSLDYLTPNEYYKKWKEDHSFSRSFRMAVLPAQQVALYG